MFCRVTIFLKGFDWQPWSRACLVLRCSHPQWSPACRGHKPAARKYDTWLGLVSGHTSFSSSSDKVLLTLLLMSSAAEAKSSSTPMAEALEYSRCRIISSVWCSKVQTWIKKVGNKQVWCFKVQTWVTNQPAVAEVQRTSENHATSQESKQY